MNFTKIFLFAAFLFTFSAVSAQRTRGKKTPAITAYKVPKLTTTLAGFKDTTGISAKEAVAALAAPLNITDAKGAPYTISSYQFAYKQIVVTEDESLNGKAMRTSALKSSLFKTSPLPPLWVNLVSEKLVPGEELYFFAVTVKDAQGHLMYAPDLKLFIK